MNQKQVNRQKRVFILIADGFEDALTVEIIRLLRTAAMPVALIAPSTRRVKSMSGIVVEADRSLDSLDENAVAGSVLILLEGIGVTLVLQTDPRIRWLINTILDTAGNVIAMHGPAHTLLKADFDKRTITHNERFIVVENSADDVGSFAARLTRYILAQNETQATGVKANE